jgi:hypothetical protein
VPKRSFFSPTQKKAKNDFSLKEPILWPCVARFFLVQHTKTGKNIPKLPQNIPKGQKIYEVAVK